MKKTTIKDNLFKIKPAARHILTIGRDLIKDNATAILELVKNSYDADATQVDITFSSKGDKEISIVINDNGSGMSYKTVTDVWMVPSTDYKHQKLRSDKKKRLLQGRKGIGRYASSILGDIFYLKTTKDGETTTLKIDWKEFENNTYLEDIEILIEKVKTKEKNGTRIEIICLLPIRNAVNTRVFRPNKIKQSYHITQKAARSRQRAAFLRGKLGRRQKFSKK